MDNPKRTTRRGFLRGREPSASDATPIAPTSKQLTSIERLQAEYLQHFSKRAMACDFEVFFNLNQYPEAGDATLAAFQRIDELESQLSIYQPKSEVTLLNGACGATRQVSNELLEILHQAQQLHDQTQGAFDITSTPLSRCWGFLNRMGSLPTQAEIDAALTQVDATKVQVLDDRVRLDDQVEINLNSIGKGYALDCAVELVSGFSVFDFIFHGGQSSVVARGDEANPQMSSESGWSVGLSHPFTPNHRLAEIRLRNQSLSTSGTARQGFFHQGKRYGHVIDPRTGWPTDHFLSATAICNSAAQSDALATAFFVMTLEEVQSFCDLRPDVGAILVIPRANTGQVTIECFNIAENTVQLF